MGRAPQIASEKDRALPIEQLTLVAFREVAPTFADDCEFSFDDAYTIEQLFTAVADVCGLSDKIKATGYLLPVCDADEEIVEA